MSKRKDTPPELITPAEAARISKKAGTTESIERAIAIIEKYYPPAAPLFMQNWTLACIAATIYDTGRIQGIREEKQRQRQKRATPSMNTSALEPTAHKLEQRKETPDSSKPETVTA